MRKKKKSISIIGAGNVATHLACALYKNKVQIDYILSKGKSNARLLAKKVASKSTSSIRKLLASDVILIAVNDDAIATVAKNISSVGTYEGIIAHTSGSVSSKVLQVATPNYGSYYPLQSFTKNGQVNMHGVPFCICGSNDATQATLKQFAHKLSKKIYDVSDAQRLKLHLAAVFANNFSNHMLTIAEQICDDNEVSFDILKPLLLETFSRLESQNPSSMQTGPAKRNDKKVITKHKSLLKDQPSQKEIYELITKHIIHTYK